MKLTWSAVLLALVFGFAGGAQASETSELEQIVTEAGPQGDSSVVQTDWRERAEALGDVHVAKACAETSHQMLGKKYAVSFDKTTGEPCRLYDLSFPTLQTLVTSFKYSALPTQKYTVSDYLNWLNGRFDAVVDRMHRYQGPSRSQYSSMSLDADEVETADWVYQLEIKSGDEYVNFAGRSNGLPKSFRASDLNVGKDFVFAIGDRQRLNGLIKILAEAGAPDSTVKAWSDVVQNPKSFLSKIRFDWNDARKVYDIALEGDFLPVMGPVALVDYQRPHKPAVEALIRGLIGSALYEISGFIPAPLVRGIVRVAVEDAFAFIDMAYKYQYNQLEGTLRATAPMITGGIDSKLMDRTLTLVFGNQTDILTAYITALAQKQKFDMVSNARRARYTMEKSRDMLMNQTNSRLVLKSKCQVKAMNMYFAECSKAGKRAVFSLLSENTVLMWNLGAPMIYRYDAPMSTLIRRGASYLLSAGLRIADLGIPNKISQQLITITTNMARAGVSDEAFLKNALWTQKQSSGSLSAENEKMLGMLYVQHLNPFLPLTQKQEANYIEANKRILKISSTAQPALN